MNLASKYSTWKTFQEKFRNIYHKMIFYDILDGIGIILSIMLFIMSQIYVDIILYLFVVILVILGLSLFKFCSLYYKVNKMEDELGIGKPSSIH